MELSVIQQALSPSTAKAPKLVVGFDGSEPSLLALDQAVRFCATWPGTEVVVVQSTDGPVQPLPGESAEATETRVVRNLTNLLEERFTQIEGEGAMIHSARAAARVSQDDPVDAIVAIAHLEGADLILLGKSDKSGLERLVLGSVAQGVLRKAPCSVLICQDWRDRAEPSIERPSTLFGGRWGRRHTYHHKSRNAESRPPMMHMMPLVFPKP